MPSRAFRSKPNRDVIDAMKKVMKILSSRRTGMVSTSAPTAAATIGATSENINGGRGVTDDRVQHASATPATEPNTTKAVVPAIVLSLCHERRPAHLSHLVSFVPLVSFMYLPIRVANPSPNASTPHA